LKLEEILQLHSSHTKLVFYLTNKQAEHLNETVKPKNRQLAREGILTFVLYFFTFMKRDC
jgi:hypothetical protein